MGRGLGAWYKTRTGPPKGTISICREAEAEEVLLGGSSRDKGPRWRHIDFERQQPAPHHSHVLLPAPS